MGRSDEPGLCTERCGMLKPMNRDVDVSVLEYEFLKWMESCENTY